MRKSHSWKEISELESSPMTKSQNLINVHGLISLHRLEKCIKKISIHLCLFGTNVVCLPMSKLMRKKITDNSNLVFSR